MIRSAAIRLNHPSAVGAARRAATEEARRLGWDDVDAGNAAIVATELASNLLKHAREGALALTGAKTGPGVLTFVAVDRGLGMDVARSLRDGFSTAGSSGTGLGAILRLASDVDIVSTADGTVAMAEMRPGTAGAAPGLYPKLDIGGFALPKEGETENGDAWDWRLREGVCGLLVCDGLGHGPYAAEAAACAVASFREAGWRTALEAVNVLDEALRPTRGAAAAVAVVDVVAETLHFCGVGNISAALLADDVGRHLVSHNGILGHSAPRKAEFEYAFPAGAALVMHSDGVTSRWRPAELAALWHRRAGLIAGTLYKNFARGGDDVVVSVTRRT